MAILTPTEAEAILHEAVLAGEVTAEEFERMEGELILAVAQQSAAVEAQVQELGYLAGVIRTAGDSNMQAAHVGPYLRTQAACSRRAGFQEVAASLDLAANLLEDGDGVAARELVLAERDVLHARGE